MIEDPALLAAGYALGTLTPDELAAYRAYLSSSAEARAEADELAAVADALALDAAPVAPPPALKAALMAKIAATAQLSAAPPAQAHADTVAAAIPDAAASTPTASAAPDASSPSESTRPSAAAPVPSTPVTAVPAAGVAAVPTHSAPSRPPGRAAARAQGRWFRRPVAIVSSVAAAAALFIGGTFVGVGITSGDDHQQQQAAALVQLNQAPDTQRASAPVSGGGTATLVYSSTLGKSALLVDDLSSLPAGKTYELWYIGNDGAVPAGTMDAASSGTTWRVLEGTFKPGLTVGVTVEPEGGSKQPTTKPLVAIKS